MTIESNNAKQDVKEIVGKCINCGLCKARDSIFKVMKEEQYSPRGKAIMLKNNQYDNIIFDDTGISTAIQPDDALKGVGRGGIKIAIGNP